jgi:hypothetical protein
VLINKAKCANNKKTKTLSVADSVTGDQVIVSMSYQPCNISGAADRIFMQEFSEIPKE